MYYMNSKAEQLLLAVFELYVRCLQSTCSDAVVFSCSLSLTCDSDRISLSLLFMCVVAVIMVMTAVVVLRALRAARHGVGAGVSCRGGDKGGSGLNSWCLGKFMACPGMTVLHRRGLRCQKALSGFYLDVGVCVDCGGGGGGGGSGSSSDDRTDKDSEEASETVGERKASERASDGRPTDRRDVRKETSLVTLLFSPARFVSDIFMQSHSRSLCPLVLPMN